MKNREEEPEGGRVMKRRQIKLEDGGLAADLAAPVVHSERHAWGG